MTTVLCPVVDVETPKFGVIPFGINYAHAGFQGPL